MYVMQQYGHIDWHTYTGQRATTRDYTIITPSPPCSEMDWTLARPTVGEEQATEVKCVSWSEAETVTADGVRRWNLSSIDAQGTGGIKTVK